MFGIDDMIIAAAITGGLGLAGDMFSANSAADANSANAWEADTNRQFQERMARNKHQYEVEDLKAAGLNPLLSVNAGSNIPSGSMANYQPVRSFGETALSGISTASSVMLNKELIKTQRTQQDLNSASAIATLVNADKNSLSGAVNKNLTNLLNFFIDGAKNAISSAGGMSRFIDKTSTDLQLDRFDLDEVRKNSSDYIPDTFDLKRGRVEVYPF